MNIFRTNTEKYVQSFSMISFKASKLTVVTSRNPRLTHGGDSAHLLRGVEIFKTLNYRIKFGKLDLFSP